MAVSIEAVQARLQNIESVKPLLEALRTISLSSWRSSLRVIHQCEHYISSLTRLLSILPGPTEPGQSASKNVLRQRTMLVVIGSERGLCGKFNKLLARELSRQVKRMIHAGQMPSIRCIGSLTARLIRPAVPADIRYEIVSFPKKASSLYTSTLARLWLEEFTQGKYDSLDLIYNVNRNITTNEPITSPLLPFALPPVEADASWPTPILDGDAGELRDAVQNQLLSVSVYHAFLRSIIAESSTRYSLMEEATRNADALSDELMFELQAGRRQKITQEMQELAVGAGLLN